MSVRVRFAPSPTGALHIGGLRTALYNYLFAKQNGGTFILRIEDTDRNRFVPGAEDYIIESLKWCGITPDEGVGFGGEYGPYRQSDRKEMYKDYARQLYDDGFAYYAFDTPEELEEMRNQLEASGASNRYYNALNRHRMNNSLKLTKEKTEELIASGDPYVIRLKTPLTETISVSDKIRGNVQFSTDQMGDQILLKSDGMPTYHLANIVDDHLMKITHVIRGEEWLSSMPIHILLYRFFGWEDTMPEFAHLPLILKPKGKGKLSKRDGNKFGMPVFPMDWTDPKTQEDVKGFKEWGFLPEAVINFIAFLGWNPGTEQEIFDLNELIKTFDVSKIGKSGARYDFEKAKWYNQQYIMQSKPLDLLPYLRKSVGNKADSYNNDYFLKVIEVLQERMATLNDFESLSGYFFEEVQEYDAKTIRKKWKPEMRPAFDNLKEVIENIESFDAATIETSIKEFITTNNLRFGDIFSIFRLALSGMTKGPSLFDISAILGKKEVVSRLEKAYKTFDASSKE